MEDWLQREAQVCKIIYGTVDQLMFHQVKGKLTAAAVWKKLASIHGNKGAMYATDLLTCLQSSHYIENSKIDMYTHLASLVVIKEHLAKISCPISDALFTSYICMSLSLSPSFKPLFTTLATNACITGKPMSSDDLIWHLNKEANNATIKTSINQQHEAMVAAHAKARGNPKLKVTAWRIKKHKGKGNNKADKSKLANIAKTKEKDENYAFLTFLTIDTPDNDSSDNVAFAVTSGHNHKAHAASPSAGVIINCGASSHFLLSHKKLLNYQ
ncbi:hypothetical protein C0989_001004 [Termitomyces sp. Mn162]|nr:hypothetical protein C0989_001004 [Termitomyces sp. Mn162]KAH0583246.1 hypothetical protein H2248_011125 [Termitomyces sp. 'cryptogamus']